MDGNPTEDSRGLGEDSVDVAALSKAHGWSRSRLISELRRSAALDGTRLPSDDSLKRMVRMWVSGDRQPSPFYKALLARAFGVANQDNGAEPLDSFLELLDRAEDNVDRGLLNALEAQTDSLRALDRRLGAHRLLQQAEAHASNMADMIQWGPFGALRRQLAAAAAEAAALAGWQALDLGKLKTSWRLHTHARALAHESEDAGVIAHVTAQQAYVLLDAGRVEQAIAQFEAARRGAGGRVPGSIRAWLLAAEAEARATSRDLPNTSRLLALAESEPTDDDPVPYVFVNGAHLARWRGNCFARAGHPESTAVLTHALSVLDPSFTRAAAGLHADLATSYTVSGDREAASHHAQIAARLSATTGSKRHRNRVRALLLDNSDGLSVPATRLRR